MGEIGQILKHTKPGILIVDENDDILYYLSHDKEMGYKVVTAKDGEESLSRFTK